MESALGMSGVLKPRLIVPKPPVVRVLNTPWGRLGWTSDRGKGGLFDTLMLSTKLRALVRAPDGRLLDERDLGSGIVTNVGVLALAADFGVPGVSTNPANLFANMKWHAWGSKETAASELDIGLTKAELPTSVNCIEAVNTLSPSGVGKPKLISTATITAESTLEIKEWGIFTAQALSATTGEPLTGVSATTGTVTATPLTASSATAKGETLKILNASESENIWGLITKNTTSVVTVPAWYKQSTGAVKEPSSTSKYTIKPVMFDHVTFAVISVVSGNKIEFVFELEAKSGG